MNVVYLLTGFVFLNTIAVSETLSASMFKVRDKKVIELGWDIPTAAYIKDNISGMETKPFDGVCFRYNQEAPLAFEKRVWTESEMNFTTLSQIAWGSKLTNNFLQLWGQSKNNDPDWYNDELWRMVVGNMKLFSKAMKLSKAKGVFFDSEFYYHNETHSPWVYNATIFPDKSFGVVKTKVRQRGREFIVALQTEMPNVEFLCTYLVGMAWARSGQSVDNLATTSYALLPSFLDGMLDGATSGAVFIEGNEGSYGYDETRKFASGYDYIRNESTGAINLISADVRHKFSSQGQIAMALYVDQLYGRDGTGWPTAYYKNWFIHNVYNGLLVSDQYVWCYSESLNWWTNTNVPAGLGEDLRATKVKFANAEALGFDMVKLNNYWDVAQAEVVSTPVVSITVPQNNALLGNSFTVTAQITQPVSKVVFYLNSRKVGEDTSFPYTYAASNLISGKYTIFAMAFTADQKHTSSNPVNIEVHNKR